MAGIWERKGTGERKMVRSDKKIGGRNGKEVKKEKNDEDRTEVDRKDGR